MDRRQTVLRHIDKTGRGIEIGPSHNPLAPKREGFQVDIIDHASREQLIAKYADHRHLNLANIEEVDFVWTGQSFADLTGHRNYYDWAIASHLIEHTPDLIGFLNDCDSILKEDGVLSLAIPDKRFCFDYFRPITGLARIIDCHHRQDKIHTAGTVAEFFLNVVGRNGQIAWYPGAEGPITFLHNLDDALGGMRKVIENQTYLDVHSWCFTPHSFRLIVQDLYSLGLIALREVDFSPTVGCEFFVTLGRSGKGSNLSRREMLDRVEMEQLDAVPVPSYQQPEVPKEGRFMNLLRRVKRRLFRAASA